MTGPPDAETLERLRQSGISVDRQGEFVHQGERVLHAGLRQALFRWLDRTPGRFGRYILRLDAHRFAYVDVQDTPLVVRAARLSDDGFHLGLSDGADEVLDPRTLTIDGQGILRCWVRGGVLEARFSTSAATVLAEAIEPELPRGDGTGAGRFLLHTPDGDFPIAEAGGDSPNGDGTS